MVPSFSIFNWIRQLRRLIGFPFRCSVIKADWGSCFVVEVWPLIEGGKLGHLEDKLHDLFRHYGRILFVDVNLRDKKGLIGFSSLPAGLAALEAQVELDGECLNIVEREASNKGFRQRIEGTTFSANQSDKSVKDIIEKWAQVSSIWQIN